jgi:cysteine desulfurase
MKQHYLDHNATTPLDPAALEAMLPYLREHHGNPSSIHAAGRRARAAVDRSRESLASLIGAKSKEIIFTSGGTESDNLAIQGTAWNLRERGRHIITCATEHHAVLHPCRELEKHGFEIDTLKVDSLGHIDLDQLEQSIRPDTILVSLMSANNETGTRHPIPEIAKICRNKRVRFHCDAIQSFGKDSLHVDDWGVDLLSLAAHKFHGPKGVGLLYARSGTPLQPVITGGSHENERRAGTENVAGIVGMAAAAEIAEEKREKESIRLFELVELLWKEIEASVPDVQRNGDPADRIGNTLNISFKKCAGEALLVAMDLGGLAVSSGSACMVGSVQPSHVLKAMGIETSLIHATVRFSFGRENRREDIPEIASRITKVVERHRSVMERKV